MGFVFLDQLSSAHVTWEARDGAHTRPDKTNIALLSRQDIHIVSSKALQG